MGAEIKTACFAWVWMVGEILNGLAKMMWWERQACKG
jgi:hypothetical protein